MHLNEYRGMDTDDLELSFSALVKRASWKAPAMQQLRLLRSIRRLRRLRLDPNSGVSLQHSQHRKYGAERCCLANQLCVFIVGGCRHHANIAAEWNDGSALDPKSEKRLKFIKAITKQARRTVRDKTTVRGFRKSKML
jgi:hypothetical protein